jgi:capsular polysaccharide export protein
MTSTLIDRHFLFLQGPHGPFFPQLARMLTRASARVCRVGFNGGDRLFWSRDISFIVSHAGPEDWPSEVATLIDQRKITDLVLYGDTRPVHATAIVAAHAAGVTVHVFEEGYLRPYWITYERGGSNGHSPIMALSLHEIRKAVASFDNDLVEAPARWGELRQHIFWGAVYHGALLAAGRFFPAFRPHRGLTAQQEFVLHLRRLLQLPLHRWERMIATFRIRSGGFPYHLALLQLEHDASFRAHSTFESMADFVALVIDGFAKGAPPHHHLVFKAHPLEDGRVPLAPGIRRLARAAGLSKRVHFVRGGKLARLLDGARSAVTINSTTGQQVLWRGMPLKIFGAAVYGKPGLVSNQNLPDFFADPARTDIRAYRDFRRFLLETSQVRGGFYSANGRQTLLRQIVDRMLAADDPYAAIVPRTEALVQQLRLAT